MCAVVSQPGKVSLFSESQASSALQPLSPGVQDAQGPSPGGPAPETSPFLSLGWWSPCQRKDPPANSAPTLSILLSYSHGVIMECYSEMHTLCQVLVHKDGLDMAAAPGGDRHLNDCTVPASSPWSVPPSCSSLFACSPDLGLGAASGSLKAE